MSTHYTYTSAFNLGTKRLFVRLDVIGKQAPLPVYNVVGYELVKIKHKYVKIILMFF